MASYVVGIDLGTTNCAVACVDLADPAGRVQNFPIAQLVAAGDVAERSMLPSFLLLPEPHEVQAEALRLPWQSDCDRAVGAFARERGHELPARLVSSAKSWLSYSEIDREKAILPWRGADEETAGGRRVSPVAASASYLGHIRAAWNARMPVRLEEQEILVTVPASFDAAARELTVRAAEQAGLPKIVLLEEPQAAFYAWLAHAGEGWRNQLRAGDLALVCDLGGGTSDFSLIEVSDDGQGQLELGRVAVGDHILLGGDNMDLLLAQRALEKLGDVKLSATQYRALIGACQRAKEQLLSDQAPAEVSLSVLGGGSKVIGGARKTSLDKLDAEKLLVEGFFPRVEVTDRPKHRRALGLRELGLPYATDPAVTRHLAAFLARENRPPTAILYNGGVMKSTLLRRRIDQMLGEWFPQQPVRSLSGTDLDLAVARGAAYYGMVRHGRGIRIRGGTARAYYIGVESAMPAIPGFEPPIKAMCVAPIGMEEGATVDLPSGELGLVVGEPTAFRFFASSTRKDDSAGAVVEPSELNEIAPIEANLPVAGGQKPGEVVAVSLSAHVTETGTLEIWGTATGGPGRWRLEYSVRERD